MNTKEKLMQLLELCIEKELNFDYTPNQVITVAKFNHKKSDFTFRESVWLINSTHKNTENIYELITKVKNYNP